MVFKSKVDRWLVALVFGAPVIGISIALAAAVRAGNVHSLFVGPPIPIDDIQSITPTRNPLSSPALSLDRLEIRHRRGVMLVSPADKAGFIAALRAVNGGIAA